MPSTKTKKTSAQKTSPRKSSTKKIQAALPQKPALKPKPKTERPHCHQCAKTLDPQFTVPPPIPAKLLDGRRVAQRELWEKQNPPRFTGHYGRFADDRFCGQACGYNYAVAHTRPAK